MLGFFRCHERKPATQNLRETPELPPPPSLSCLRYPCWSPYCVDEALQLPLPLMNCKLKAPEENHLDSPVTQIHTQEKRLPLF